MKDEVADNRRGDETREGENVRNRIDVLMWRKLSENLKKGFPGLRDLCSKDNRRFSNAARDQ